MTGGSKDRQAALVALAEAMLELVAGLDAAGVAGEQGFGATWRMLSAMLDLSAGQARARVRDAEQLAIRRTLTEHAQNFDPQRLRVIARRVLDQLDADGPAPAEPDDPCPASGELHIRDRRDGGISDVLSRVVTVPPHCATLTTSGSGTTTATPK